MCNLINAKIVNVFNTWHACIRAFFCMFMLKGISRQCPPQHIHLRQSGSQLMFSENPVVTPWKQPLLIATASLEVLTYLFQVRLNFNAYGRVNAVIVKMSVISVMGYYNWDALNHSTKKPQSQLSIMKALFKSLCNWLWITNVTFAYYNTNTSLKIRPTWLIKCQCILKVKPVLWSL